MDPTTGTFWSVDPLVDMRSPQHHNPYSYAANNPISFVDPTGEIAVLAVAAFAIAGSLVGQKLFSNSPSVRDALVAGGVSVAFGPASLAPGLGRAFVAGAAANSTEKLIAGKLDIASGETPDNLTVQDVVSGGAAGTLGRVASQATDSIADDAQITQGIREFAEELFESIGAEDQPIDEEPVSQPTSPPTSGAHQRGAMNSGAAGLAGLAGAGSALSSAPVQYSPPPAAPQGNPTVTIYDRWCPLGC